MENLNKNEYNILYSSEPKQIDKNLERFIKQKEEALERKLAEKNREWFSIFYLSKFFKSSASYSLLINLSASGVIK